MLYRVTMISRADNPRFSQVEILEEEEVMFCWPHLETLIKMPGFAYVAYRIGVSLVTIEVWEDNNA
ncbi:MAG: hypothetical protein ABIH46_13955 [Chloroflexota bacterium]